ncbi:MAG TPA: AMP-binding protein [Sphingomicrobium sp.]|nr:AMP-binding protein [Sphingomicrobium sp.]
MQSYSLTVDKFLDHAAKWFPNREVVETGSTGILTRRSYGALRERSNRLSGALAALGAKAGDRIATLAWNTLHHFELTYAAMGAGLVCHTLNPRLMPQQIGRMIEEADDRLIAVSAMLLPLLEEIAGLCPPFRHIIVLDDGPAPDKLAGAPVSSLEQLLLRHGSEFAWGGFGEETPAGLCYTSGTTGSPKGVVYTHRSNYLHTLRSLQADAMAISGSDVVLMAVPMFHANGWGIPFAAPAVGAGLVLPGRHADGASLARLIRNEGVTLAIGVQTVWLGVVDHLRETGGNLPTLKRVIIGGSNCPEALIAEMEKGLGVRVQTSWGMTELSPLGTISSPDRPEHSSSGRPPIGLDLKLKDVSGRALDQQRNSVGHLWVKGASVVDRYFGAESDALDDEGYFDTGDLAMIDDEGNLTIRGRSKDLIKSGGEWINPAEIEAIVGRDPSVSLVAVISMPDAKWGERPLLVVQPRNGERIDGERLLGSLRGKVVDWWIPERIAQIESMPLATSGKIDKNRLRADFEAGEIVPEEIAL